MPPFSIHSELTRGTDSCIRTSASSKNAGFVHANDVCPPVVPSTILKDVPSPRSSTESEPTALKIVPTILAVSPTCRPRRSPVATNPAPKKVSISCPAFTAASPTETCTLPTVPAALFAACNDTREAPTSKESVVKALRVASDRNVASCVDTWTVFGMSAKIAPPVCTLMSVLDRIVRSSPAKADSSVPEDTTNSPSDAISRSLAVCSTKSLLPTTLMFFVTASIFSEATKLTSLLNMSIVSASMSTLPVTMSALPWTSISALLRAFS